MVVYGMYVDVQFFRDFFAEHSFFGKGEYLSFAWSKQDIGGTFYSKKSMAEKNQNHPRGTIIVETPHGNRLCGSHHGEFLQLADLPIGLPTRYFLLS